MNTERMIKKDVALQADDGKLLQGWLYTANNDFENFSPVAIQKGQTVNRAKSADAFATKLCDLGFAVFLYDKEEAPKKEGEAYCGPYYW